MNSELKLNTPDILIYLIYHDDVSYKRIVKYEKYDYIKMIKIESTKYFESIIFKYLFENKNEWIQKSHVGILTYTFETKIKKNLDELYEIIKNKIYQKNDVITFFNVGKNLLENMKCHTYLGEIFDYSLPKIGINDKIHYDKIPGFYCNYWLAKTDIFNNYVTFANEYMKILDNNDDTFLQKLVNSDAQYRSCTEVASAQLQKIIGYPYYIYHCFVMERLPCIYFFMNNIATSSI